MDFKNYLITELTDDQNEEYIETTIISILKEHKLSLSQLIGSLRFSPYTRKYRKK